MRKLKVLIKSLFVVYLCLGFLLSIGLSAESNLFIDASNSVGEWKEGIVTEREVAFTDKTNIKSETEIYVVCKGKYQLIAYVHHNWRKSSPCIYIEAIDSTGKVHRGYHKLENIWYLNPENQGRWFFVSLSDNPYWDLPEGILRLRFWVEAKDSTWGNLPVPMENKVSIGHFFLVPVVCLNSETFLPWMLNIESGTGDWQIYDYDHEYATNFIKTQKRNSLFFVNLNIPTSADYIGWLSILSEYDGDLEVGIKNGPREEKNIIKLKANKEWKLLRTGSVKLNRGPCLIYFKNLDQNKLMIDFFFLTPELKTYNDSLSSR